MEKILFKETQINTILIAVAILISLTFGVLSIIQVYFNEPLGNNSAPNWLLIALTIASAAASIFIYFQKLKFLITEKRIFISFGLFTAETIINLGDITNISIRKYNALKEFMGWGIRNNGNESCFTVSGNVGVGIVLNNNQKILVGTYQPNKLQEVLDNFLTKQ